MEIDSSTTLENKIVNAIDRSENIDNSGLIALMYPDYLVRDEIFYNQNDRILYRGKITRDTKKELEEGTKSFIAISSGGFYDVDFIGRENIVRIIYNKWNKVPSEAVLGSIEYMKSNDFYDYCKKFWVLGRSKLDDKGVPLFNLAKVFGKSKHEVIKTYFELREFYKDYEIFSYVMKFMDNAINIDKVSTANGWELNNLKNFNRLYRPYIGKIVKTAYEMKAEIDAEREYRTLWLLSQFGKGDVI